MQNTELYTRLNKMKKRDICKLALQTCKHGHNLLSHPQCAPEILAVDQRIGFLDIESSDLVADFGYMFSYCIKELDGDILGRHLTQSEVRSDARDKNLVAECIRDMMKFDRIVTYFGMGFDLPFIRTRAVKWGIEFPMFRELFQTDVYQIIKRKFRLRRRRMEVACDLFGIPSKGHRLNPEVWQSAMAGEIKSLQYIFTHNVEDVESLEALWKKVKFSVPQNDSSI